MLNQDTKIMKAKEFESLINKIMETHTMIIHRGSEPATIVETMEFSDNDHAYILSDKTESKRLSASAVVMRVPCFVTIEGDTMTWEKPSENTWYKVELINKVI